MLRSEAESSRITGLSVDGHISQTLAARTAEAIRHRILTLAPGYHPGERLFPETLAESLGVSSTPIREALRLLSNEGLVELLPRRGARVANMTADEIRDLTSVRSGVEVLAIRFRGGRYSPDEVAEMNRCLDICEAAIADQDVPTYRRHDTEFHRLLVAGSHSPALINLYEQLHKRAQILELFFKDNWDSWRESLAEHRELAALLATGPMPKVEKAVWTHWEHARKRISTRFAQVSLTDLPQAGSSSVGLKPISS